MNRFKNILTVAALVITVMGIITFSMFILEESLQTIMFGSWAAQDAQDWDLVLKAAETNEKLNFTLKCVNYSFGWIQPFAFIAYRSYTKATDYYIEALKAKVLAHSPQSFIGKKINFDFTPRKIEQTEDGKYLLSNGRIFVVVDNNSFEKRKIVGVASEFKRGILIK